MRILLDTHLVLWFLDGSPKMPERALEMVRNPDNTAYMSDISLWEVSIKHLKRPDALPRPGSDVALLCDRVGILRLPLSRAAIKAYELLDTTRAEGIHKDPFDRMLMAQAKAESMLLLTHDKLLALYDEPLVAVV